MNPDNEIKVNLLQNLIRKKELQLEQLKEELRNRQ